MNYGYAFENADIRRIDKLNMLCDPASFWDDVRKLTKNVKSDHGIKRWQILSENRFRELTKTEV